ncbi:hypothetical protein RB195_024289 [Necator americanus]|uniref:Secreted protein n=1 Tax=Necator americanus TaxID=51031 RepID=A0ABR1EMJ0_NECAM
MAQKFTQTRTFITCLCCFVLSSFVVAHQNQSFSRQSFGGIVPWILSLYQSSQSWKSPSIPQKRSIMRLGKRATIHYHKRAMMRLGK